MRVQVGDTVTISGRQGIGIVERRDGLDLTLRLPHERNCRSTFQRDAVRPLAEAMFDARKRGTKYSNDLSLTGASTLAELVAAFGYATQQMRSESLSKVFNQLARAGLQIIPASDRWSRDDTFVLRVQELAAPDVAEVVDSTPQLALQSIAMPEIFWPTAFGLDPNLEITFLKSLTASSPILCLLHMPDDSELHSWLPATWEGMVSWAYRAAQNFDLRLVENSAGEVFFGPAAMLHAYLNSSVLGAETPQLKTDSRSLNLISLKNESEIPVDMHRIRAIWPGPVFEFKPQPNTSSDSLSADEAAIIQCLFAVAGAKIEPGTRVSPLKAMLWSKETCARILARASTAMGSFLSGDAVRKFKGSNESATALALKADIANWIRRANPDAKLSFEKSQETLDEWDGRIPINRVDLFVEGIGQFEVESMLGSGPMEGFYHQKVSSH